MPLSDSTFSSLVMPSLLRSCVSLGTTATFSLLHADFTKPRKNSHLSYVDSEYISP